MPVSGSGVIFGEYSVPKGVGIGRLPEKIFWPGMVWQAMQSPACARYLPRSTCVTAGCGFIFCACDRVFPRQNKTAAAIGRAIKILALRCGLLPCVMISMLDVIPVGMRIVSAIAADCRRQAAACPEFVCVVVFWLGLASLLVLLCRCRF